MIDPPLIVSNTGMYNVGFSTSLMTITDHPVQFPSTVHLTNKRTTIVTVTTTFTGSSSIATADHAIGDLIYSYGDLKHGDY